MQPEAGDGEVLRPGRIGRNVRKLRAELGITQAGLAERSRGEVSQSEISALERGSVQEPTAKKLEAMAEALGVSILSLFTGRPVLRGSDPASGLKEFLGSGILVTDEERVELENMIWPSGRPSHTQWLAALQIARETVLSRKH